jgi:hypothetical protein
MDITTSNRDYMRCEVYGGGEIISKDSGIMEDMDIENMSAKGIQVRTQMKLQIGEAVELDIAFGGAQVQRTMIIRGVVTRIDHETILGNSYGIKFEGLTDLQRADIDEVMRITCTLENTSNQDECGDTACIHKKRD